MQVKQSNLHTGQAADLTEWRLPVRWLTAQKPLHIVAPRPPDSPGTEAWSGHDRCTGALRHSQTSEMHKHS